MNVVKDKGIGKVGVQGEGAGDLLRINPIDQLLAQDGMIFKRDLQGGTAILFLKAAELQGIVFAARADVIGEEVILSDLVTRLNMVPEPTGIRDQFAVVVDQGVIDGNDSLVAVTAGGVVLQRVQATLIEGPDIPVGGREETVEARLVGG